MYTYNGIKIYSCSSQEDVSLTVNEVNEMGKVVIISGAGVSTNSGIPDYRSETGIFSELAENIPEIHTDPTLIFSRNFINANPEFINSEVYVRFHEKIKNAQPFDAHHFAVFLHKHGLLEAVLTQNIDGLYQKAGLPQEKLVEFHGNCHRDDIVLYGDNIPDSALKKAMESMLNANVCIVMGTSLQVSPFCAIPNLLKKDGCRILVDKCIQNTLSNNWNKQKYNTCIKFESRRVTLKNHFGSTFNKRKKWPRQYLYNGDVTDFTRNFIMCMNSTIT